MYADGVAIILNSEFYIVIIREAALIETNNAGIELTLEFLLITDGVDANETNEGEEEKSCQQVQSGDQLLHSHSEKVSEKSVLHEGKW